MEKVQKQYLRFVYEDFNISNEDLLQKKMVYQVYTLEEWEKNGQWGF